MNLKESIPKINSIAIFLIIAFILNIVGGYIITPYLTSIFSPENYMDYTLTVSYASIIKLTLGYLLNIILAFWTYKQAKNQNENPIIWAALTLFFGLIALVLFYLSILIKEIKKLNSNLEK